MAAVFIYLCVYVNKQVVELKLALLRSKVYYINELIYRQKPNNHMQIKKMFGLITASVIFISCIFLYQLIAFEKERIQLTSYPRFICLLTIHFIILCFISVYFKFEQQVNELLLGFLLCLIVTALIECTQLIMYVKRQQYYQQSKHMKIQQPSQIIYLNLYFLIQLFCSVLAFILGIILITLLCLYCAKQRRIAESFRRNITELPYSDDFKDEDCPICLSNFIQGEQLAKISCTHVFHTQCLRDWMKINTTCPNCRFNLFTNANIQQISQMRQNL